MLRLAAVAALFGTFSLSQSIAVPEGDRSLKLYHIHTGEQETIVFKRNGVYDPDGLKKLDYILRDWRIEQPTNMDPHLFDLLWQVYQDSGSHEYIHVVCGYRSPSTNALLRRRSSGVAEHSQHMLGKAMDYFIPDVPLEKLREIGLRMQVGGVGYYPTSGSPFVHMDTGGVRMWPRMTRDQLVRVFPNGRTLYIPSDSGPLPGYDEALAAYKARKGAPAIMVASAAPDPGDDDAADTVTDRAVKTVAAAGAPDMIREVPRPRLAPRPAVVAPPTVVTPPTVVAMADTPPPAPAAAPVPAVDAIGAAQRSGFIDYTFHPDNAVPAPQPLTPPPATVVASAAPDDTAQGPDFDAASELAPPVPAVLAAAMAARDRVARSAAASLPIAPTAVVATVDVSRPLRAEAMTTAVLRQGSDPLPPEPPVLAYASGLDPLPTATATPRPIRLSSSSVPIPQPSPLHNAPLPPAPLAAAPIGPDDLYSRLPAAQLTLTALDTRGLRMWIAGQSTREKRFALLTMPDFTQVPGLLAKPVVSYAAGFGDAASAGLRTDHFTGSLVSPLAVVDLTRMPVVASR